MSKVGQSSRVSVLLALLFTSQPAFCRLVRQRSAREGILDARLVAIVRQQAGDKYEIEEVFWGDEKPGDSIDLPGFKLFTEQEVGPDLTEPISSSTRILLFLQPRKDNPSSWEPTDDGNCFFWVQESGRVFQLRGMAQGAVALRRQWEDAVRIPDPRKRVEALWLYLHLRDYGVSFLDHTKAELRKIGPIAGDYFAEQFDAMAPDDRSPLYYEAGSLGSERLHQTMIRHLKSEQQAYEGLLGAHGLDGKAVLEYWNSVPQDIQQVYGDIPSLLYGLRSFSDRGDLPLFREAAIWALNFGVEQACVTVLGAFREMPDKDNLSIIGVIWKDFEHRPTQTREIVFHDVVGALCTHRFPETVPLLAPFVTHPYAGPEVEEALSQIVGKDLGRTPRPWLDWCETHTPPK